MLVERAAAQSTPRAASLVVLLAALIATSVALARQDPPTLRVPRLAEGVARPRIDGVVDDPAWAAAAVIDDLRQSEPAAGAPISEATEIRLIYDSRSIFVALLCDDRDLAGIRDTQMRRDANLDPDDRVEIFFDTFHDRRNAFWFQIGPAGSQGDALISRNGSSFNKQWDGIWWGEARITERGWEAEMEIPVQTLNFDPDGTSWGFNLRRFVRRRNEEARWAAPTPQISFFSIANAGVLTGIEGLEQGVGLDVVPYALARWSHVDADADSDATGDLGADAFWRMTPNVKLALSLNTDFAQTEVDDRRVNLTRFPLFFPEKRDFFLEDSGAFVFGSSDFDSDVIPFFSRRIGIGPSGEVVPLLAAAKLTGQTDRHGFGVLGVRTDDVDALDGRGLFVARGTQNLGEQSDFGAIVTHGDPSTDAGATTLGLDANYRTDRLLGDDNLRLSSFWLRTDDSSAIAADAYRLGASYPQDEFEATASWTVIEDGFDPKLGFVPRTGIKKYAGVLGWRPRLNTWIRQLSFDLVPTLIEDSANRTETIEIEAGPSVELDSGDEFGVQFIHLREVLDASFDISDDVTIAAGDYTFGRVAAFVETSDHREVDVEASAEVGEFFDGESTDYSLFVGWRPSRYATLGLALQRSEIEAPGGDLTVHIARVRVDAVFTPRLSWANFLQFDDESDELGLNSRLWWIVEPGAELFFVVNQGWQADPGWRLREEATEIALKVGYTLRF